MVRFQRLAGELGDVLCPARHSAEAQCSRGQSWCPISWSPNRGKVGPVACITPRPRRSFSFPLRWGRPTSRMGRLGLGDGCNLPEAPVREHHRIRHAFPRCHPRKHGAIRVGRSTRSMVASYDLESRSRSHIERIVDLVRRDGRAQRRKWNGDVNFLELFLGPLSVFLPSVNLNERNLGLDLDNRVDALKSSYSRSLSP
jgi:hypothetical protein